MAYDPPDNTSIPFRFTESGYSPPDFDKLAYTFGTKQGAANLSAAINVLGRYQTSTYTYLKYCPTYVIGYTQYGVQILKGRCVYGGIRDLGAYIFADTRTLQKDLGAFVRVSQLGQDDLGGYIRPTIQDYRDLGGILKPRYKGEEDLPASLQGFEQRDLTAQIDLHSPSDLAAYLNVRSRDYRDLPAYLRGWQASDLPASLTGLTYEDLPAELNVIEPADLPAYLKVWPQDILPAYIRGWGELDLGARIQAMHFRDLPATIGTHLWENLTARIKGYGREVPDDLPAYIKGFAYGDLPAILRATYLKDLSGYLFPIQPVDLKGRIHGFDIRYLPASLNVEAYPYDLPASIYLVGGLGNLTANIVGFYGASVSRDLPASLYGLMIRHLSANISGQPAGFLSANITPVGYASNLHAEIYPKMIRLSTIVNIPTMEHLDLAAVVNISCFNSASRNLSTYIYTLYKGDLPAYIKGRYGAIYSGDLSASIGYADSYVHMDRLPISISISPSDYTEMDTFHIYMRLYKLSTSLPAYIYGQLYDRSISASIFGEPAYAETLGLAPNIFRAINFKYNGLIENYEMVELAFKTIVKDYIYSSAGDTAWKRTRSEKWRLSVKSFLPPNLSLQVERKLHKAFTLYDLKKYTDIDSAVRAAIDYVTYYPQANLSASINNIGKYSNLAARVFGRGIQSDYNNFPATITAIKPKAVVSFVNDTINILT
jgi:hypothetical protein